MRRIAACGAHIIAAAVAVLISSPARASETVEDLIAGGHFAEALPILEAARDAAAVSGRRDREVATVFNNLGSVYGELGRTRDAQSMYERSLALRHDLGELETRDVARTLNNLGAVYWELGMFARARETLERAADLETRLGADQVNIARVWINLGMVHQSEQHWDEAETMFRKALDARERTLGSSHREVAVALNNLGVLLQTRKRFDEAGPLLERAVHILEASLGAMHPWVASGFNNLGVLYSKLGRAADAEKNFKKALNIASTILPASHPHLASYMTSYAQLLRRLGRKDEAKRLEESAARSREAYRRENLVGYTIDVQGIKQ
jgi:tetratricopeptide (TPR) repeat protein